MSGARLLDRAGRESLARWALRVGLALTAAWGLLVLVRVLTGVSLRGTLADVVQFGLVVAYVGGVPIASGLAARMGDRPTRRVRTAIALIAIWLTFMTWAATLSFRG